MATYARDERKHVVPARTRGWLLAAVVPFGPHEFRASVGAYRIDACTALVPRTLQWGMGYVHNLSKRTASDATFARASNHDGARWAVGGASVGAGVLNSSSTGVDIGIRHNF
jgi:predicted porin